MSLYSAILILVLVMDPLGNIPFFISVLGTVEPERRHKVIIRETFFAFLILIGFLFAGKYIMMGLHITEPALGVAGGIILFLISIKLIFPPAHGTTNERQVGEPFIVPLAVPMVAGPSSLAMVLLFSQQHPDKIFMFGLAITVASLIFGIILLFSNPLRRILGQKGLIAMERLMGMLLTVMAVQMFLDGINHYMRMAFNS